MMAPGRQDELLAGWCDDALSPAEEEELDRAIADDPALARRLALYVDMHRQLHEQKAMFSQPRTASVPRMARRTGGRSRRPAVSWWRRPLWAAAAALLCAAAVLVGIQVAGDGRRGAAAGPWIDGHAIVDGRDVGGSGLELRGGAGVSVHGGTATIAYADGTRCELSDGSRVTIVSGPGKLLELGIGSLRATVTPQPQDAPMRIATRSADIEVVGTAFTVDADADRTSLQVTSGIVRFVASGVDRLVQAGDAVSASRRREIVDEVLVARSATWSFLDTGMPPAAEWRIPGFPVAGWSQGPAPLGFDTAGPGRLFATVVPHARVNMTIWFRHEFQVSDPATIVSLRASLRRDEGVLVHLNGVEVARIDMPAGPVDATTPAIKNVVHHESMTDRLELPVSALRPGRNCLAVESHQWSLTSSDLLFELELVAGR